MPLCFPKNLHAIHMQVSWQDVKGRQDNSSGPMYLWEYPNVLDDAYAKYFNIQVFHCGYHHSSHN